MLAALVLLIFLLEGEILHRLTEFMVIYDQTPELRTTIRDTLTKFVLENDDVRTELVSLLNDIGAGAEAALKGEQPYVLQEQQQQPAEEDGSESDYEEDMPTFTWKVSKPLPSPARENMAIVIEAIVQVLLDVLKLNATASDRK